MADARLLTWLGRVDDALTAADVPHALAGGLALATWATPRATTDIDLVIAAGDDVVTRARGALAAAGVVQTRRRVARFRRLSMLRVIGLDDASVEPLAIALLMVEPALQDELLARAARVPLGGKRISVVSPEDLVLLKLFRSSDQDVLDIRGLAAARTLDRRYLERQARALRLLTPLRRALRR